MTVVYVIAKITTGPCGHGEPGEKSIAMMHEGGQPHEIGVLSPVFTDANEAEAYRKERDSFDSYKVFRVRLT